MRLRKKIAFLVGDAYRHYLVPLAEALPEDEFDLFWVEASELASRERELEEASLLVTVHSSVLEVMKACERLKGKVPSLTIQDGIIEYRSSAKRVQKMFRYRPLRTDYIAVFGERSRNLLVGTGVEPSRIFVTGSPRFDSYRPSVPPTDGYVLVTMANRPAHRPDRLQAFYRVLSDLLEVLERRGTGYRMRLSRGVRTGGAEAFDKALGSTDPFLAARLQQASEGEQPPLVQDLEGARAVITTPSTVSIEAMALGRPLCHLLFDPVTTYLQSAWTVRCKEDVDEVVDELVSPPIMKMEFQNVVLGENLLTCGSSSQRVADCIRQILR